MKLSPAFTFIAAIAVSLLALTNSTGAVEMKKHQLIPFSHRESQTLTENFLPVKLISAC